MPRRQETDDAPRRAFGHRVRVLRVTRGLSQETLADLAGIHRTYLSDVERGQRNISLDNIHALAAALGVDAGELFTTARLPG